MRRIASPRVVSRGQLTGSRRSTLLSGASMPAPSSADSAASARSARCERSASCARCCVEKARNRALRSTSSWKRSAGSSQQKLSFSAR